MKLSNRVHKSVLGGLFASLLLFGGLSFAHTLTSEDWGTAVDGLQMRIVPSQEKGGDSKVPKFRV
jgi:hypothetical protein